MLFLFNGFHVRYLIQKRQNRIPAQLVDSPSMPFSGIIAINNTEENSTRNLRSIMFYEPLYQNECSADGKYCEIFLHN